MLVEDLLERVAGRSEAADAVRKTDETLTLSFEAGRLKAVSYEQEEGVNLRVLVEGKMGFAGTTTGDAVPLVESAFASARLGDTVPLALPRPAPLPAVATHYPRAAAAAVGDLADLGRELLERLSQDGCQVSVTAERSVGSVRVVNNLGVSASYDVSSISLSAELTRVAGDDVLIISDYLAGADTPDPAEVDLLVDGMLRRLGWAGRGAAIESGSYSVCFAPAGLPVLLLPLRQACLGKSVLQGISPLAGKVGTQLLDPGFSLSDDPLLDGRAGSRPIDDEGVTSRGLALIEKGTVGGFIYDLETAARAGCLPSGHGHRSTFGKPQATYSNVVLAPGANSFPELLAVVGDGLLVYELLGVGQGNVIGGAFSHPVALAYRVVNGEIVGRVKDATVAGNAYELLARIAGIGSDMKWSGNLGVPSVVIEGVAVAGGRLRG